MRRQYSCFLDFLSVRFWSISPLSAVLFLPSFRGDEEAKRQEEIVSYPAAELSRHCAWLIPTTCGNSGRFFGCCLRLQTQSSAITHHDCRNRFLNSIINQADAASWSWISNDRWFSTQSLGFGWFKMSRDSVVSLRLTGTRMGWSHCAVVSSKKEPALLFNCTETALESFEMCWNHDEISSDDWFSLRLFKMTWDWTATRSEFESWIIRNVLEPLNDCTEVALKSAMMADSAWDYSKWPEIGS